jgi:hypothetical protein
MTEGDDAFRALFTREHLLASDWYKQRLAAKQAIDIRLWGRHARAIAEAPRTNAIDLQSLHDAVQSHTELVASPAYLTDLTGTIGADPSLMS